MVDTRTRGSKQNKNSSMKKAKLDASSVNFTIKNWNMLGIWSWGKHRDNCVICQSHVMDLCTECQSTVLKEELDSITEEIYAKETDERAAHFLIEDIEQVDAKQKVCPIAWGKCKHSYHLHCIEKWLKTKKVCPLDNGRWQYGTEPV